MPRIYRIIVSESSAGVRVMADEDDWIILGRIYKFENLHSNDDHSFGNIQELMVNGPGFFAVAYKEIVT